MALLPRDVVALVVMEEGWSRSRNWSNGSETFSRGDCHIFLEASAKCDQQAAISRRRSWRRVRDDDERRAARAEMCHKANSLLHARRWKVPSWLQGIDLSTLNVLQNPVRRPPQLRDPLPRGVDLLSNRK